MYYNGKKILGLVVQNSGGGGSAMYLHKVKISQTNNAYVMYNFSLNIIARHNNPINTYALLVENIDRIISGYFIETMGSNNYGIIFNAETPQSGGNKGKCLFNGMFHPYNQGEAAFTSQIVFDPTNVAEGEPITYTDTILEL